ncbi:MAG: aminoacetone oxidase family FAD-binding enzyme [Bacilli bacterium]|nr:aminoacetone oxidase family FAD-binding enzyme [Bacilli bacterium]
MKDVIIIGGGPAGIFCAAAIKEHTKEAVNVTIVERLDKIGKKILATGNGKCNFTNKNLIPKKYSNPKFVTPTLSKYGCREIIDYFESIGLLSKEISEGRVYPYTESATTVLEVMRMHLSRLGVNIKTNYEVHKITEKNGRYFVYNKNQKNDYLECDYLVFACGGCSAPILGSNGSGFPLLKPFKVKVTDLYPGLVGFKSDITTLKALNGLRFKCNVSVIEKKTKKCVWIQYGEVQFKGDGISGIVVMEASTFVARKQGNYIINLDLMPEASLEDTIRMLEIRKELFESSDVASLLTGMLPKMIGSVIVKKASVDLNAYVKNLTKANITKIANLIKAFPLEIRGDYGFERSQVTVGGVALNEIDPNTLAIKKMNNAYICGEMIDIDGECGGYNLQWALASGYLVGCEIAGSTEEDA